MHPQPNAQPNLIEFIKYQELAIAYENMLENYSMLSKECQNLKKKEDVCFEKYVCATQEKEKILVDSQLEAAHHKMKIKLLQEALTKRNVECTELNQKYRKLVFFSDTK